jgi:hypothetical protein
MSVTWNNTVRDTMLTDGLTAIDASGSALIKLYTAGAVLVSTVTLNHPSFTEASQTLTLVVSPAVKDASATGNAAAVTNATITTGAGTVVISGLTVGVGSGDIQLNSTTIAAGVEVDITSGTISG